MEGSETYEDSVSKNGPNENGMDGTKPHQVKTARKCEKTSQMMIVSARHRKRSCPSVFLVHGKTFAEPLSSLSPQSQSSVVDNFTREDGLLSLYEGQTD